MSYQRMRFDGWIGGVGTRGGTRLVLGHWPESPFGAVSDVMVVRRDGPAWAVTAGPLRLRFVTGGRGVLGGLLRAVPGSPARRPSWVRLVDLPARVLRGVRTYGSAGSGRREWFGSTPPFPALGRVTTTVEMPRRSARLAR